MHGKPLRESASGALSPALSSTNFFFATGPSSALTFAGDVAQMEDTRVLSGNYRIEASGWGLDSNFFVEKTDLMWERAGNKKLSLRHAVQEGAIIFVRLLLPEAAGSTLPVAYQVTAVRPMNCDGRCEVRLSQLHPRTKVPFRARHASYEPEDSTNTCEPSENPAHLEQEEILR